MAETWIDGGAGNTALSAARISALQGGVTNVKEPAFGAKGDGVTDDYAAIQAAVATINAAGGGVLLFPPGTYLINQYKITGGPNVNTIADIRFDNCNGGMQILGYGAIISVKGNFNKLSTEGAPAGQSYENTVIPFLFNNCSNFELAGFEINGNVQSTTRDGGVTSEGPDYGIITFSCTSYALRNIYVHHFSTDGVAIGFGSGPADKQVIMENVRSTYNARQGMSISQARGMQVVSCEFSNTGRAAGTYGGHPPMAGVDIEPNFIPPSVDVKTGLITFIDCLFYNNTSGQFINSLAYAIQKVTLQDCSIIAGTSTYSYPLVMAIDGGVLDGCYIDTNGQRMVLTWGAPADPAQNTRMRNCLLTSKDAMLATDVSASVVIEHCRFISTATTARAVAYSIYITNPLCVFENNYVFFPAAAYAGSGTFDIALLLQNMLISRDNVYQTDMNPAGSQHFAIDYGATLTLQNELFTSAGAARSGFRPAFNSNWNNSSPYANGYPTFGQGIGFNVSEVNNFIVMVSAMPSTGGWTKGDIAFNTNVVSGGKIGWVRLTTGSANVLGTDWQPFGPIDPVDARYLLVPATTHATSYTLALVDAETAVEATSASVMNITVPPNSSVAFPVGSVVEVMQYGAGQVTVVAGAGVTLRTSSSLTTRAQYSVVALRQRAANEWVVSGDLT